MDIRLRRLLDDLYRSGQAHDAVTTEHTRRMLNITPDTGELLWMLIVSAGWQRVLELGTSNGYSTLWLADACRLTGGRVTTVERSPEKHALATQNFEAAGLDGHIDARLGEIADALSAGTEFDLVFLDSDRSQYVEWWPALQRSMRVGGLLVADNATSHESETAAFRQLAGSAEGFHVLLVPVGNGQLLVLRDPEAPEAAA